MIRVVFFTKSKCFVRVKIELFLLRGSFVWRSYVIGDLTICFRIRCEIKFVHQACTLCFVKRICLGRWGMRYS